MQFIDSQSPAPEGALVLDNTDDVLARAEEIHAHAAVVLQFPKWTDGRAYSQAVLLRGRLRYAGEIIATGPPSEIRSSAKVKEAYLGEEAHA